MTPSAVPGHCRTTTSNRSLPYVVPGGGTRAVPAGLRRDSQPPAGGPVLPPPHTGLIEKGRALSPAGGPMLSLLPSCPLRCQPLFRSCMLRSSSSPQNPARCICLSPCGVHLRLEGLQARLTCRGGLSPFGPQRGQRGFCTRVSLGMRAAASAAAWFSAAASAWCLAAGAHDYTVGGLELMLGVLAVPATDRKNKPTNKGRITID